MSGVAAALRRAATDIENALLDLGNYAEDEDVAPGTRRSIRSAVLRGNDIANRLATLADREIDRDVI